MKETFVDANVFIRFLTNDDHEKADKVETLLSRAARGEVRLITTEVVLAEVVWVLESSYDMKNHEIAPMIKAILDTPGIE
ncbi:MAG: PilT protein domain protein, partial [Actinobacteria bacterium]|nr:PilT protein domain protein [Actinomycetota bacterium]